MRKVCRQGIPRRLYEVYGRNAVAADSLHPVSLVGVDDWGFTGALDDNRGVPLRAIRGLVLFCRQGGDSRDQPPEPGQPAAPTNAAAGEVLLRVEPLLTLTHRAAEDLRVFGINNGPCQLVDLRYAVHQRPALKVAAASGRRVEAIEPCSILDTGEPAVQIDSAARRIVGLFSSVLSES